MRSQVSTGYLTPQAAKGKETSKVKRAGSNESLNPANDFTDSFFEKLMNCPIKRQLVLQLINSEKDNIEEYKRKHAKTNKIEGNSSSLSKIKKNHCESPTALFRRRVLERQNRKSVSSNQEQNQSDDTLSGSSGSNVSSSPSPISFSKLLDGVVAYVEIKSKDQDRSSGAKMLMKSMGATIRDKFTKDVTHVIFKDGSFTTYQKAKLMKIHLVSVLWIEAVRRNKTRVPEKKFPALGIEAYDTNVSAVCSQLQKDYEDIIREELHRSLTNGTPLPSTQSIIDKRRTIMPCSSQEFRSSQDVEVERILRSRRNTYDFTRSESPLAIELSPEISEDDSDLNPFINGTCIKRNRNSMLPCLDTDCNILEISSDSNMDITSLGHSVTSKATSNIFPSEMDTHNSYVAGYKENCSPNISSESKLSKITPAKEASTERNLQSEVREIFPVPNNSAYKRKSRQLFKNMDAEYCNSSSKISSVPFSGTGLRILSKNVCQTNNNIKIGVANNSSTEKSTSTNMSSLQISSNKDTSHSDKVEINKDVQISTSMSSLVISSDSSNALNSANLEGHNIVLRSSINKGSTSEGFSDGKYSFSPINPGVMEKICQDLETSTTDDFVTRRGKNNSSEKGKRSTRKRMNVPPDIDIVESENEPLKQGVSKKSSILNRIRSRSSSNNNSSEDSNPSKRKGCKEKAKSTEEELNNSSLCVQITPLNEKEIAPHTNRRTRSGKGVRSKGLKLRQQIDSQEVNSAESSASDKKLNKTRRLYDSNECLQAMTVNDEMERLEKRNEAKKRRNEDTAVNANIITVSPNTFLTAKAKEFVDQNQINIKSVLNKDSEDSDNEKSLPKKKKTKKNTKQILRNSDADEQAELAAEFVNNKTKDESVTDETKNPTSAKKKKAVIERRKSVRLSKISEEKLNLDKDTPTVSVFNRRSTMEFYSASQISANKKLKIDKNKRPSIVCTKLHKEDIQVFNQIVKKLGGFVIEDEVSSKTTHLVAGEPKRTINMLRAMTMGCWILKHEWLLKSLEEGKWLPEEDYEETGFSPAVQQCRLQRQAFGPTYTMNVFEDCGPIYIARGSIPRCSDLQELVVLCKGKICTTPRNATIVVGELVRYEGVKCVKETWLLDCVTFNKRMSFKKYIITS